MNCYVNKCEYRADYGTAEYGLIRCKVHAVAKDTRYPFECCTHATCLRPAFYMSKGYYVPSLCEGHKSDEDVNVYLQACYECKYLCSGFRGDEKTCRVCVDKIYQHIDKFVDQYKEVTLEYKKNTVRMSVKGDAVYTPTLVLLQFVKQDKKNSNEMINTTYLTDLARTINRPVVVVLCNTGEYKPVNKKTAGVVAFPDRLSIVKEVVDSALMSSCLAPGSVSVKRVFFDMYA